VLVSRTTKNPMFLLYENSCGLGMLIVLRGVESSGSVLVKNRWSRMSPDTDLARRY
jgi:hypothetical protein